MYLAHQTRSAKGALLSSHLHDAPHGRCRPLATAVPPSCSLGLHVHSTASFRPVMPCSTTILISTTTPLTYMVRCQRYFRPDHCHLHLTIFPLVTDDILRRPELQVLELVGNNQKNHDTVRIRASRDSHGGKWVAGYGAYLFGDEPTQFTEKAAEESACDWSSGRLLCLPRSPREM